MKVLVADDDFDSHDLVRDILEINFRDVEIEGAHSKEAFFSKINEEHNYDLILINPEMEHDKTPDILTQVDKNNPELFDKIVVISDTAFTSKLPKLSNLPVIPKPFSLDHFSEVLKKACVY